jgi:hypothetical protein
LVERGFQVIVEHAHDSVRVIFDEASATRQTTEVIARGSRRAGGRPTHGQIALRFDAPPVQRSVRLAKQPVEGGHTYACYVDDANAAMQRLALGVQALVQVEVVAMPNLILDDLQAVHCSLVDAVLISLRKPDIVGFVCAPPPPPLVAPGTPGTPSTPSTPGTPGSSRTQGQDSSPPPSPTTARLAERPKKN